MRRSILVGILAAGLFSATPGWAGPVSDFISAHPRLATSIRWQNRIIYEDLGAYNVPEAAKIPWKYWSDAQKQQLEDAYEAARSWLDSSSPLTDFGDESSFEYPPPNLAPTATNDFGSPWTCVDSTWAWNLYLRWIAQNLAVEMGHKLPWSVLDYDTDMLKALFDSTSMMALNPDNCTLIGAGQAVHQNYVKRTANRGESLIAPPHYTYAFLAANQLIGANRRETIVLLLGWVRDNLWHIWGSSNYSNNESTWQYRGMPPITRIIDGTWSPHGFGHWTAGCHGTVGFLRNVLRAANIPMEIVLSCSHAQAYFMSERLYLDHGDDPYNSDFQASGKSPSELLISEQTFNIWFHDSRPDNQVDPDVCAKSDNLIGAMSQILSDRAEQCSDGIDNDHDGLTDCADTADCPELSVPYREKLLASDFDTGSTFGSSADLNGHRAIVGAQSEDERGYRAGAAYVFEYTSQTGWVQGGKLMGSDAYLGDFAGYAVAVEGDVAVSTSNSKDGRGAAYVFARNTQGTWAQQAKLTGLDSGDGDAFGTSTSLRGGTLAVGAWGNDSSKGAVYVFNQAGTAWTQNAKLVAADAVPGTSLGIDVAVSGDTIAAGGLGAAAPGPAGSVYVFRHTGATWTQEAKLMPPEASERTFGRSLALDGDLMVVGAPASELGGTGSAYVFRRSGTSWVQEARIFASDGAAFDGFGYDVGVGGGTVAVGAYGHALATGAVYVFRKVNGQWTQQREIAAWDGMTAQRFGAHVPLSGDTLLVAAYGDDAAGDYTGAAYLYGVGNTDIGQCMFVAPASSSGGTSPVTLGFAGVAAPGSSTVTVSAQGPGLPSGFQLGTPATYYDIATTADYQGLINVCINTTGVSYTNEATVSLLHYENGAWVDVCASAAGCTRNTSAHTICGIVASLSPFVVAERSLLPLTIPAPGYASTLAYFLTYELASVGSALDLDVYLPAAQPDPNYLGQIQLQATVESQGIYSQDLGTRQLSGLQTGAWNTVTFSVPAALQQAILTSAAAGHFTVLTSTRTDAPSLILNNLRFSGAITPRSASAPTRGGLANVLSFESASDWSATGAMLASDSSLRTDGAGSLRVVQTGTYSVIRSADLLTRELFDVADQVVLDVQLAKKPAWGALQVLADCALGQTYWIGQADLTTLGIGTFNRISLDLPASAKSAFSGPNQACLVRLVVNGDAGEVHLDNLRL